MKLALNIHAKNKGFSLVELAICFLIISLLVGNVLGIITRASESEKYLQTEAKMDKIVAALRVYANEKNRLPCPASAAYFINDSTFGTQRTGSPCSTGSLGTMTAEGVSSGVVPFLALGLPSDYLFDAWGRKITYAVDTYVVANDISSMTESAASTNINIIIKDGSDNPATSASSTLRSDTTNGGNVITSNAAYVLISHGPNGSTGFLARTAGNITTAGSVNELRNCTANSTGNKSCQAEYWNSVFIAAPASKETGFVFDDIVVYKLKDELR